MGRGRHGRRRHMANGACKVKGSAFTTWDAAMSAVARTPDAIRAYRGDCCGYFHITRYTEDEYAQRVAEFSEDRCTDEQFSGIVENNNTTATNLEDDDERGEQGLHAGDAGSSSLERGEQPRFAPSPATLARRLQARRNQGR